MTEGDLPVRHYLPSEDVMMEMLEPSETVTHCPYKGDARYWNVTVGGSEFKDMVWSYSTPLEEVSAIAGFLCFYDERVSLEVAEYFSRSSLHLVGQSCITEFRDLNRGPKNSGLDSYQLRGRLWKVADVSLS